MTARFSNSRPKPPLEETDGVARRETEGVEMLAPIRALLDPVVTREEEAFLRILPASSVARETLIVRALRTTSRR